MFRAPLPVAESSLLLIIPGNRRRMLNLAAARAAIALIVCCSVAMPCGAARTSEPIRVPDGSPADLLKFIDTIRKSPAEGEDLPAVVAHVRRVCTAVVAAVDKIDAAGTDEQQLRAVTAKLDALALLRRINVAGADKRLQDYLRQLRADKRAAIATLAAGYYLSIRLADVDRNDPAELEKLLAEVREHVKVAPPTAANLRIAVQTALLLERAGMWKEALEAYVEFAAAFALSDDAEVVENAKSLAGSARYLSLPGQTMDVSGKALGGRAFDMKQYAGKVVLVDFWATWSGPSVAELPTVRECYEKYHDRGFEVVAVSLDDDRAKLEEFVKREELPWPVLFDDSAEKGWKAPLAQKYGVISIPRSALIGRDGKVVSLAAHGDDLWDLLAAQIGPAEVKKPADDADKPQDKREPEERQPADEDAPAPPAVP